jgi:glycine/D-amino acid oxidase-like deaminating enzyme
MSDTTDILICGAGIAGIATAYHLAVEHGIRDIMLVDERAPLSLTSDKSTECYRNWWPGPDNAMVALMDRSIDLMEELAKESNNTFHLNRRGYLYLTADPKRIPILIEKAYEPSKLGAGPLRIHDSDTSHSEYSPSPPEGYEGLPTGADLLLEPTLIQKYYPYVSEKAVAALHVRRAGWFSAQQLGMYLLEKARSFGVKLYTARVTDVIVNKNRIETIVLDNSQRVHTDRFVIAAGPLIQSVTSLLGIKLPVYSELHLKVALNDHLGIVPRDAPMLIWNDPQTLPWTDEERSHLLQDEENEWLLNKLPPGAHTRPEGSSDSQTILMLWGYKTPILKPTWPIPLDPLYPEINIRGLSILLPRLRAYFQRLPQPTIDGGYYTKTQENRPLIGPLPVTGAYILGALSGYGLMAACAGGELLAAHVTSSALPAYASAFRLDRYQDPDYQTMLENWGDSGQL